MFNVNKYANTHNTAFFLFWALQFYKVFFVPISGFIQFDHVVFCVSWVVCHLQLSIKIKWNKQYLFWLSKNANVWGLNHHKYHSFLLTNKCLINIRNDHLSIVHISGQCYLKIIAMSVTVTKSWQCLRFIIRRETRCQFICYQNLNARTIE